MTQGLEMNEDFVSSRNFGIELESHPVLESDEIISIIRQNSDKKVLFSGWRQTHSNKYWHLKTDSTCGGGEKNGWEIVSYKGSGIEDITHMAEIAGILGDSGLRCGPDCGFHVHVDLSDFEPAQVAVLLARWVKIEKIIMESVPRSRSFNRHCRTIRNKIFPKNKNYDPEFFWHSFKPKNFSLHGNREKRVTMNLVNYATCIAYQEKSLKKNSFCNSTRRTVEFRFPEGTFCENDVKNWICLFIRFVDASSQANMPFNLFSIRKVKDFFEILGFCEFDFSDLKIWLCDRIIKNSFSKRWKEIFLKEKNKLIEFV
jgi:hypothetical protein